MRIGVIDIGTNSTRLLVVEVGDDCSLVELDYRTKVTRLGSGVDESGFLSQAAIDRVFSTLQKYVGIIEEFRCQARLAIMTSAVRDAANGGEFAKNVRELFELDAQIIDGRREAQLTYLGATHEASHVENEPVVVIDIGGGSTELVIGNGMDLSFDVSINTGVIRQTERHLHSDPVTKAELDELISDVQAILQQSVPPEVRTIPKTAIAVAGTPASLAAIIQELEPFRRESVHGYKLSLAECRGQLIKLAKLPLSQRRNVTGLHPDRALTIIAGIAILIEVMRIFDLDEVTVSEHDIMRGVALEHVENTLKN